MISIPNKPHFVTALNGDNIAYCYLRKNACSSWKSFILRNEEVAGISHADQMKLLKRKYRLDDFDSFYQCKYRIAVLRDPIQRLYSGFINQVVMRLKRGGDVIDSVEAVIDFPISEITFHDFVYKYLISVKPGSLDGHFKPQSLQMYPKEYYSHIFKMDNMNEHISNIFGKEVSESYFLNHINQTSRINKVDGEFAKVKISQLNEYYNQNGSLPSFISLLGDEIAKDLQSLYRDDFKILSESFS